MNLSIPMSELPFPSGLWTGFYAYDHAGGKHGMDLSLEFSHGRITGDGADPVGLFVIEGRYEAADGACSWTKTYVGAHEVFYSGFRDGKGIWGTWSIERHWRGGFHIWPMDGADAEEWHLEAEEPMKIGAPHGTEPWSCG
jgi:hypothetical protein